MMRMTALETTDPQDELFDVLDADGRPVGFAKSRRAVHRDGEWHAALHIWVGGVGADGEPFVVFQRRSATKDTFPGLLDVSVGGHLRSGETLAETVREAEEEIGVQLELAELTRIGRRRVDVRLPDGWDREIQDVYAVRRDLPLAAYRMHPEEVSGLLSLPIGEALALFEGERPALEGRERGRDGSEHVVQLTSAAFVPFVGDYPQHALRGLRSVILRQPVTPFQLWQDRRVPQ